MNCQNGKFSIETLINEFQAVIRENLWDETILIAFAVFLNCQDSGAGNEIDNVWIE